MTRSRLIPQSLGAVLIGLSTVVAAMPASGADLTAKAETPGRHALWFDGESSFVWLRQPIPDGLKQGTVELWFALDRHWDGGAQMPLIGDDAGRMNLVLRDGRLSFNKELDGVSTELSWRPARLEAGWHHVAGVWGAGGMKLFLDGTLVASRLDDHRPYQRAKTPYDIVPVETRLGLASTWWADQRYHRFAGQVAFARISEDRLYEQNFTPRIDAPAESKTDVLRYDFTEGQGALLRDSSGRSHDALIAGCVWRVLDEPPKLAQSSPIAASTPAEPPPAPVVVLPFGCLAEMLADPIDLQGFHLTAAWLLNGPGALPVATEARALELAPSAGFPHRDRLDDGTLDRILKTSGASAVVSGFIEPVGGDTPENRLPPARLNLRVLRPDHPPWTRTIDLKTQSAAAYHQAQRSAALALFELLVNGDRQAELKGLADDQAPEPVRQLWRRAEEHLRLGDPSALLRAAADAAESARAEPRAAKSWRLLAEAYAWLGTSPSRSYATFDRAALVRARAALNLALLLDRPTPEVDLTGALIARFVPDYLAARASALRLADADHPWSPAQKVVLALAAGEESRLPEAADGKLASDSLARGRIRLINAKRPLAQQAFEEAWELDPLNSSAPALVAEAAGTSGVGTLRRIASGALVPGLVQAARILAWESVRATGDARACQEFLKRLATIAGGEPADLADQENAPDAIDRAVNAALGLNLGVAGLDQNQALGLLAAVIDFEHRLSAATGRTPSGIDLPGLASAPDPLLVRRLARVEAQSGFNVLLQLLVQSLGVPDEAGAVLVPLIETCGYDTMTAHWATLFLTRNKAAKGTLPWPPTLPRLDPAFDQGYYDVIFLEPGYKADLYRDARRRFPSWDLPWREVQRPVAYSRNPYDERNVRLWVRQVQGPERRKRLDQALNQAPESADVRRLAAEVLLHDVAIRDEARGLTLFKTLIDEDPDASAPYRALAEYFLDDGRPDEALATLARLAERPLESLAPVGALLRMATIHKERHESDELRAVLATAAQSFQANAVMRYAWALSEANQLDQAIMLFEAGRLRYPPGASFLSWEATALFKAGRQDQARTLLRDFARQQPYAVAAEAVREYVDGTGDTEPIPDLKDRLQAGRAGNLLLADAALKRGRTLEALNTAQTAQKNQGRVSSADRPNDQADAADLLARVTGARYVALRAEGREDEARVLMQNYARRQGLTHLAAILAPLALSSSRVVHDQGDAAPADAGNKDQDKQKDQGKDKDADRTRILTEALTTLAAAAKPDDPGAEVARQLREYPRLAALLRDYLDRDGRRLGGPDNQLRMAAHVILGNDLLPDDRRQALASALVRLNPRQTWVSLQSAVFDLAFGPDSQPQFLKLVQSMKLPAPDTEAFQTAAHSRADWYLLGPFPDDRLDGIRRPFFDETEPVDLKASIRSGDHDLRWRQPLPEPAWGGLSLTAELGLETPSEAAVFYAYGEIDAKEDSVQPLVLTGPQAARVILNGRELALWLHSADFAERLTIDLPLKAGVNRLLLKLRYPASMSQSLWCQFPPPAEPTKDQEQPLR
ncbi:LamG-like jellyroll fold domain-containing protein [Singulisphaera sp. Ch08]|uniref:LamG-like jellyroll fold domain-containing protein n=1 Tax=Singulisphaera sp. Ch08 TaxID=3120278 RepID=A0AAU7C908_9BACT